MITIGLGRSPHWSLSLTIESSTTYEYGPQIPSITNPMEKFLGNFPKKPSYRLEQGQPTP